MGKSKRHELTAEEIMAWADGLSGVGRSTSAKNIGVSEPTISRWREKVGKIIRERFDIDEYRLPLYGLYSLWLSSVMHNLKRNDVTMTVAFGKGMQLFQDKVTNDVNTSGATDDELKSIILKAANVTVGQKESDS